jgi:hypothetical protein
LSHIFNLWENFCRSWHAEHRGLQWRRLHLLIFFTDVIKFYWLMLLLYPGELYRLLGASSIMFLNYFKYCHENLTKNRHVKIVNLYKNFFSSETTGPIKYDWCPQLCTTYDSFKNLPKTCGIIYIPQVVA